MNNVGLVKAISAEKQLEKIAHDKHHIDTLISMYPDLDVYQTDDNILRFYSAAVNNSTDDVEFTVMNVSGYTYFHYAFPLKNIQISCKYCDGKEVIHSIPSRIPLFVYYGSQYGTMEDQFFNVITYEDICKANDIPQEVIGKCHLHILNWIDEHSKKTGTHKLDLTYLNQAVKRLMPFM